MRKLLAMFAVIMLLCGAAAIAEGIDFTTMTDEQLRELRTNIDVELAARQAAATMATGVIAEGDVGEYHVAILGLEMSKDYKDNPAIVVKYMFTNNGTEDASFLTEISDEVFQGGVELENGISVDGADASAAMVDVKPGASVEIAMAFVLRDTTSPVDIEIGKLIDFSDEPIKIIATVALPE